MRIDAAQQGAQAQLHAGGLSSTQDFMTLLVAQLRAQDPLSPMDPTEFMSQLSQLQSVAELSTISSLLSELRATQMLSPALSLIGRTVQWYDATGALQSATVERVELWDGQADLVAGDRRISLEDVVAVS
ncbi:MAG: flagellar hook capping FlgD N-terminal domain-containing protein [Armatimonadota bacterium]|nr:flagellar hook capping FlgD N-terminal domain-containing protein [Armatimonadota bacterium]